jgi:hypothetical protein
MQDKLDYAGGLLSEHVHKRAERVKHFQFRPDEAGTYYLRDLYSIACKVKKEDDKDFATKNNVEVVYFRHPETAELFCFFYGSNDMTERFEEEFGEPFSYWNNSDHPDELTEEEWYGRLRTWEEVLNLDRAIGPQGLSQVVLDKFSLEPWWSYVESGNIDMPTIAQRAKRLAETILDQKHFEDCKARGEEFEFSYFTSKDRSKKVKLLAKEISATLQDITLEQLLERMEQEKQNRKR